VNFLNLQLLTLLLLTFLTQAQAGGPLTLVNNKAVVYPNGGRGIILNFDRGDLGPRTNATADSLALRAISLWNSVNTASISLSQGADMPVDVTSANVTTYINGSSASSDGLNPFVYDTDGSVIDAILGVGQSDFILGIGGSSFFTSGRRSGEYTEGYLVLNGSNTRVNDDTLVVTMAHELGHFFGVDHSQLDDTQGLSRSNYVLMYPTSIRSITTLHEDDVQSVSQLYPESNTNLTYATFNGRFQNTNGSAKLGVNVWLQETVTGKVYSGVSDYLDVGNGEFKLLLPAGTYILQAEAIQADFFAGSSVGPHAKTSTDLSFENPISRIAYKANRTTPFQFKIVSGCVIDATFRSDGTGTNTTCNIPPIANSGSLFIIENQTFNGVLTGESRNSGNLTFSINTNARKGVVTLLNATTGAYTYVPSLNETGLDSFTFNSIEDGQATSNAATINITIAASNNGGGTSEPPVFVPLPVVNPDPVTPPTIPAPPVDVVDETPVINSSSGGGLSLFYLVFLMGVGLIKWRFES